MRKMHALLISSLLVVSACTPVFDNRDEVIQETKDENNNQSAIIPNYNMSEQDYRMILTEDSPKVSTARAVTTNQMGNRMDIDEFERGLRRHSKDYFSPENYFFQPGQYLEEDTLLNWLGRESSENENGLNPELNEDEATEEEFRDRPRYISNIIEQDYLAKTDENKVELSGVTIGISLRTVYNFTAEGESHSEDHSTEELLQKGKEYANEILERIRKREELNDVPVVFALYEEEESSSKIPGKFLSKGFVKGSDKTVNSWENIDEKHVLFPSDEANEDHFDDAQIFSDFRKEVSDYFPNFVGMIANGFYVNGEMREVSIEIPIQFQSESEVVGFTQYVYSLVNEMFADHYNIQVNIHSMDEPESLIVKKAGEKEPFVHVYQ
ncbi:Protein involved in sex pheromone biosynthesis [Halobacillus karajensis]|uniref:Protein involved in sex pheromone biosynthesis n=1 Tax=Halobacillus karajensis TaxID=195088 RepID=A0A024P6D8_9BACI|nr:CamS family sex pheromone protein [Halobacillus karajensis]CDQ20608.1 Protein involved in sex pheromone biosynthesis [Halobacillus karajensis]CDQ23922.1 Protein involved in sex pheromone biosynthesis [Halobacillus karajensis]CDQ27400.1 Protein involved in sex pheromone biosynthesis [Halobacillus karajensis]SEH88833.1 Protein involved in sex pheromone biosynthesis [Halobacillus karajensis]